MFIVSRSRLCFLVIESHFSSAAAASAVGDMGTTMGVFQLDQSPWAFHSSSRSLHAVEFLDELAVRLVTNLISHLGLGAPDEDELSIVASEGGLMPSGTEDSAGLPTSGAVAQSELVAILGPSCYKNRNGMESSTLFRANTAGLLDNGRLDNLGSEHI